MGKETPQLHLRLIYYFKLMVKMQKYNRAAQGRMLSTWLREKKYEACALISICPGGANGPLTRGSLYDSKTGSQANNTQVVGSTWDRIR